MRILYDGFIYSLQKAGGVNRYFSEIISRLPASDRPVLFGETVPSLYPPSHPRLRHIAPPAFREALKGPIHWAASKFDLIHPTYYHLTSPLEWDSLKGIVVLTVYDFVFAKYADRYQKSEKLLTAQKSAIERADLILCISNSTRADLLERFPESEPKSLVTHLAANIPDVSEDSALPESPYFLFVGSRVFYKNFSIALECVSLLRHEGHEVDLVVVGPPWNEDEKNKIASLNAGAWVHLVEFPEDTRLAGLYKHAVALIYPSEYEGFGLPPLEAMTLGTPVLALNVSSLPEVIGEGGILLDPLGAKAEDFAKSAYLLLTDASVQKRLSEAARQQAQKFHWDRTARETLAAYHRAMGESS